MSGKAGLTHQDWETLYVHCKMSKPTNVENKGVSVKKTQFYSNENKIEKQIEDGKMSHKKVSTDIKEDFKKWRNSKGMTQKEVAVKLSVNHQIITKFETGQLNNDPKLVGKIKRLIKQ
jgi:ribosome-binding protein aMBF1 (putative translation factor)